jgi:hypothetical protein
MITVTADKTRKLITLTMTGFTTPEEATSGSAQVQITAATNGWRTGEFFLIVDQLEGLVQSQSAMEAFQAGIAAASLRARKIAVLSTSSLARLQSKRIAGGEVAAMFENRSDAEEWLFADPPEA